MSNVNDVRGSVFNLANAIIGAGILTLPFAVSNVGLGVGVATIVLSGALSAVSCAILFHCSRFTDAPCEYSAIAAALRGPRWGVFTEVCQVLYALGSCVGYLVICDDELGRIAHSLSESHGMHLGAWGNRWVLMSVIVFGGVLPLSSVRSLHALRYASFGAVACVVYMAGLLVWRFQAHAVPLARADAVGAFRSAPLLVFAFNCQVPFVPIIAEFTAPTWREITQLLVLTFAVTIALYEAVATVGYVTFAEAGVKDNVLDSFEEGDLLAIAASAAMVIVLVCSFPLYAFSVRSTLAHLLSSSLAGGAADAARGSDAGGDAQAGGGAQRSINLALTAAIVVPCAILSMAFESLEVPLGLTGALAGTSIVFIVPAALLVSVETRALEHGYEPSTAPGPRVDDEVQAISHALLGTRSREEKRWRRRLRMRRLAAYAFGVFGAVIGVIGAVATVMPAADRRT